MDPIRFGFIENRLFGIYYSPNTGSTLSFVAILFALFSAIKNEQKKKKLFRVSCIIANFVYIALSGSRVTILTMLVVMFLVFFAYVSRFSKFRLFLNAFIAVICCVGVYFSIQCVKFSFSCIPPFILRIFHDYNFKSLKIDLNRIDIESNQDVSNLRFKIWLSALDIFKTSWMFGVSPRNLVFYAKEVLPETYISKSEYLSIHNTHIGVFVCFGVLGVFFFYCFYLKIVFKIIKGLRRFLMGLYFINVNTEILMLVFISVSIFCLFEPEIILANTILGAVFWLYAGEFLKEPLI
jgi:O-antigen ligase